MALIWFRSSPPRGRAGSRPGKTSAGQKIQRAVQKSILQCSAHVHSSLPDWARHHAILLVGPEAKAATATRAITLAGILKLFRRLRLGSSLALVSKPPIADLPVFVGPVLLILRIVT